MHSFKPKFAAILLAAFFTIAYISCRKMQGDSSSFIVPGDLAKTTASVEGYVTDQNGQAVAGAVVTCGAFSKTTDANGYFRFTNIQISKNNGYVKAAMPGYFSGSRSFLTSTGKVNYVRIQLIPKTNAGSIDATTGGSVTSSGIRITLPAGSVVNASTNKEYKGITDVAVKWIDPTGNNLSEEMPGDLRGIASDGTESGLQTFGMVAVELTGSSGELLQIAPGKKATVLFSIPTSLASSAPATIPLWYFDETIGRWKEEGVATKSGNNYVAEVSHFSFWNCDVPFPLITFTATVVSSNGNPLTNAEVRIKCVSDNSFHSGYTDSSGYISGKIPANKALILEILDKCNSIVYSQNIGPFTENTNLQTVTVTPSGISVLTISGTLTDCNNAPVTDGYAEVNLPTSQYGMRVTNGHYSFTITNCPGSVPMIIGVDYAAAQQSSLLFIPITSNNMVVPVVACGTSTLEHITYALDGIVYSLTSPADNIMGWSNYGVCCYYLEGDGIAVPSNKIKFLIGNITSAPGTSALINLELPGTSYVQAATTIPVVTITEYGLAREYIAGSFTTQVRKTTDNTLHTLTCNFRVKRYS